MTELKPIKRPGRYQACLSFTGSVLDAEIVSVDVGVGCSQMEAVLKGRYQFPSVEEFNQTFLPVFEGTKGFCIEETGIPALYGYKLKREGRRDQDSSSSVVGSFLPDGVFTRFVDVMQGLPSVRAMINKENGWKAYLVETDDDVEMTLSAHVPIKIKRTENVWTVFQKNNGHVFLTNEKVRCSNENEGDESACIIGFVFTEKPYKGQQKISIELTTEADVELAKGFLERTLDSLASRV